MGRRFREEIDGWARGAITNAYPDKLPKNASPRALNAAWVKTGYPSKRRGMGILTAAGPTPIAPATEKPAILALGTFNGMEWGIFDDGRWMKRVSGVWTNIDAAVPVPFTAGTAIPSWAVAQDRLYVVNGTDKKATNGTTITGFGIAAPSAPTITQINLAVGNMKGTYNIALTAANTTTGAESSLSNLVSGVAVQSGSTIVISWTFPSDPQVNLIRVHIFKQGLTDRFYRVTGPNVTPAANGDGGYTSGTLSITLNLTDNNINNLTVSSPGTHTNDPPPTGAKFIAYHNSRMWLTDGKDLFYSNISQPDAFNATGVEKVNPGDGQSIVAFASHGDDNLVIGKSRSMHRLMGPNDPNTWEIKEIDPAVGIKSARSLLSAEGVLMWQADQGVYQLVVGGFPVRLSGGGMDQEPKEQEIGGLLNSAYLDKAVAAFDKTNQRIYFAVPESGKTRNTIIFPYNIKLGIWEDRWNPMDVSAFGTFFDANGAPYIVVGNYKGRAFSIWDTTTYVDGVRLTNGATTFTLTGTPTTIDASSLTDSGATFDTTSDGLAQIPVIAVSPTGVVSRNIIASNTGTVLTLASAWSPLPTTTWTYYIGCPNFEFDTIVMGPTSNPLATDGGSSFNSRNFKHVFVHGFSPSGSATVEIQAAVDGVVTSLSTSLTGGGDLDAQDLGIQGDALTSTKHIGLGKRGKACGLRVIHRAPNVGLVVLGLGVKGTEHGYKD